MVASQAVVELLLEAFSMSLLCITGQNKEGV